MPEDYGYKPDKIGEWSERKIRIVTKYAGAYSTILARQRYLKHYYIDGFTGGGMAVRRETGEAVETTAKRILDIEPPFVGYHLVDFNPAKAQAMKLACARRPQATAYCDDATRSCRRSSARSATRTTSGRSVSSTPIKSYCHGML
jgi:three-Cys-motif partner protein